MIARYTSLGLNDQTTDFLHQLVQVNIDSRDSCREAAERTQDKHLQSVLHAVAQQRDDQARALQSILWTNAETASDSRSVMSSVHGMWMNVRVLFNNTPDTLIDELLKLEDHVKQQYITVRDVIEGRAIRQLLQEQLKAVSVATARISALRKHCSP